MDLRWSPEVDDLADALWAVWQWRTRDGHRGSRRDRRRHARRHRRPVSLRVALLGGLLAVVVLTAALVLEAVGPGWSAPALLLGFLLLVLLLQVVSRPIVRWPWQRRRWLRRQAQRAIAQQREEWADPEHVVLDDRGLTAGHPPDASWTWAALTAVAPTLETTRSFVFLAQPRQTEKRVHGQAMVLGLPKRALLEPHTVDDLRDLIESATGRRVHVVPRRL